jgi:hypothetical protein
MDRLLKLFCDIDDFYQSLVPQWYNQRIAVGQKNRQHQHRLSMSEMMTIIIDFHQSHYLDCQAFYTTHV